MNHNQAHNSEKAQINECNFRVARRGKKWNFESIEIAYDVKNIMTRNFGRVSREGRREKIPEEN
jgi:hypothetical protein